MSRNEPAHRYKSITSQQSIELTNMLIPSTPEFSDIETGELFTAVVNPQNPFDSGLEWIENIQLPKRLFLISATEFDDRYLYLHDDWRYRFSGNNLAILFSTGKYFCDLSPVSLKLLKYLTIAYINENSASVADKFAQFVATTFKQIEVITRESLIEKMQMMPVSAMVAPSRKT